MHARALIIFLLIYVTTVIKTVKLSTSGLDPARPMFPSKWPDDRLNANDAKFVDIIHTTNWLLGQHKPIGNIDFYPNGGNTKQPGCEYYYFFGRYSVLDTDQVH